MIAHFLSPGSWRVYPDVVPALERLRAQGLSLGVISNWDSTLASLLEAHGLAGYFEAILISAIEETGKPGAEIFRRACRRVGADAREVLHVGDSLEEDYLAASRAGLQAILLDRGGKHKEIPARITALTELPSLRGERFPAREISGIESPVS